MAYRFLVRLFSAFSFERSDLQVSGYSVKLKDRILSCSSPQHSAVEEFTAFE
jgi:hypothetical protein